MARRNDNKLLLGAFMQASNVTQFAGSWRYPFSAHRYLSQDFYVNHARTLDCGAFDLVFFDDRQAMPSIFGNSPEVAVRTGARPVKLDLTVILSMMAGHTRRIGLGGTFTTTYSAPYQLARMLSTLDHLSAGRAIWNVVTSINETEAQNYGIDSVIPHDDRYDRADEFMEVVTGLWDSWEPDALVENVDTHLFADPSKVHELNYSGTWWQSRGPLTVPRSPQRWPLIIQAGISGRGREFAARWADLIFTPGRNITQSQEQYSDLRARVTATGRQASDVRILPTVRTVVGETKEIAEEKSRLFDSLVDEDASLALLSELANFDFSRMPLDASITEELLSSLMGARGIVEGMVRNLDPSLSGTVTLRDLVAQRGSGSMSFAGTGAQVADQIQNWFESEACDGFVVAASHLPGAHEDFVRGVIPELRRRGLVDDQPREGPLRQRLGLDRRFR